MKPCCEKWTEATGAVLSTGPAAMAYPGPGADAQIEHNPEAGSWDVYGCCGGQCFVLTDLKFCPWCGAPRTSAEPPSSPAGERTSA